MRAVSNGWNQIPGHELPLQCHWVFPSRSRSLLYTGLSTASQGQGCFGIMHGGLWVWSCSTGKDFGGWGELGQPSSDRRMKSVEERLVQGHPGGSHQGSPSSSGLGSNAASSVSSSNSWSRWGLSALIKCSVSALYFPCLEFLAAVFNMSYGDACLTPCLLYCSPVVNRTCLAHSTSPATQVPSRIPEWRHSWPRGFCALGFHALSEY